MAHIILTGFSGTGKSRVGREVARALGCPLIDTDDEIERRAGKAVHAIFETDGEAAFRALERKVLEDALSGPAKVISTGGGTFINPDNRALMLRSGVVVCLEAKSELIMRRLSSGRGSVRPLLRGQDADPLQRIVDLKASRQGVYAQAHWTVHTDNLQPEEAAQEVIRAARILEDRLFPSAQDPRRAATVHHASGAYPVIVAWGALEHAGDDLRKAGVNGPVHVISDDRVWGLHGATLERALQRSEIEHHVYAFKSGEASKGLGVVDAVYTWLAERRAERGHTVIAFGGGVVGDLAGLVAATYLRGMPFVQLPTSVAAMNDAAIGGKVAVNLPVGKNLVGSFYQPKLVLADTALLRTLPRREQAEGWAEAIKHGLILDADLFETLARRHRDVMAVEPSVVTEMTRRSMAIKARIVSEDERETLGRRILLNYGHTVGHALEAATSYGAYLHGEAVSVGMMCAIELSRRMGLVGADVVNRQREVLETYGLPTRAPGIDPEALLRAMEMDKKTVAKTIRWVLLAGIGHAVVRADVPRYMVAEVLADVTKA